MKELIDIITAYKSASEQGKKTALATVVLVEGSAYRKAGARMLITEDGQLTGAISGGCLEGDALRKARMVILRQKPLLVTYDTRDDDDAHLGISLGCNGIIHILIEPVTDRPNNPVNLLQTLIKSGRQGVLVTIFSLDDHKAPQPGTCLYLSPAALLLNGIQGKSYCMAVLNDAKNVLESQCSAITTYTDQIEYTAFVEYIKPAISLVIIGAGNDAIPLTKIAAIMGWDITVVDGRPNYALARRFPDAKQVLTAKPTQVLSKITVNRQTTFVLMTHNYNYELALLKELLPLPLMYIGILGPKKKTERMLADLKQTGTAITEEQLQKVYGPVGLDIGSEGAEEIALAIIAEIKAVASSKKGYSLKYKPATIHTPGLTPANIS